MLVQLRSFLIVTAWLAEKGMAKLKQRFSLKKQPSQNLAEPANTPYPMAAGGHHAGNPRATAQGQNQSAALRDEATAVAAAMAASELSAQEPGRLSEHRSLDQQEEEAMLERAIKVRHVVCHSMATEDCFAMGQMGRTCTCHHHAHAWSASSLPKLGLHCLRVHIAMYIVLAADVSALLSRVNRLHTFGATIQHCSRSEWPKKHQIWSVMVSIPPGLRRTKEYL